MDGKQHAPIPSRDNTIVRYIGYVALPALGYGSSLWSTPAYYRVPVPEPCIGTDREDFAGYNSSITGKLAENYTGLVKSGVKGDPMYLEGGSTCTG